MSASLRRIGAIASTTFIEMVRMRVFYVLGLFGLVLILSSSFVARISFQQELQVTKDIALGAVNFFLCLLAIVATAQMLPRDLEDRVIYSVLAKPVRRFEYLLGKFLGLLYLLSVTTLVMSAVCLLVIYFREQSALREAASQFAQSAPEDRATALSLIHAAGLNTSLFDALLVTFAKAAILGAVTLCISSFATSSIFTISSMAMIYLVGHLESIARDYWLQQPGSGWITRGFFALVAFVFPDLQAFNIADQIVGGGTFSNALLMQLMELSAFYTISYLLLGIAIFYQREL